MDLPGDPPAAVEIARPSAVTGSCRYLSEMFELVALLLFVAVPFVLGYGSGSYLAALLPTASLIASVVNYGVNPPAGTDEVDVIPGLWIGASVIAVTVCLGSAALARRTRRRRQA